MIGRLIRYLLRFIQNLKSYTQWDKVRAYLRLETEFKGKKHEVQRKRVISPTVLIGWCKQKSRLLKQAQRRNRTPLAGGRRGPKYPLLEAAMKMWFKRRKK